MRLEPQALVAQLRDQLEEVHRTAHRAAVEAQEAARTMATPQEKREDARVALEFGGLARGQGRRGEEARQEIESLDAFLKKGLRRYGEGSPVGLGAIVDVLTENDDGEEEGRTFIVLPVGAGRQLSGPGGDGFLTVITPASPVGRALLGRRAGESLDVAVGGTLREWTILEVS